MIKIRLIVPGSGLSIVAWLMGLRWILVKSLRNVWEAWLLIWAVSIVWLGRVRRNAATTRMARLGDPFRVNMILGLLACRVWRALMCVKLRLTSGLRTLVMT